MSEEQNKSGSAPESNGSQGLEGLLSNPELLRTLGTVIGNLSGGKNGNNQALAESVPAAASVSADGLSSLLSNPEMMEKLPEIIATLKPIMGNISAPPAAESKKEETAPSNDRDRSRDQLLLSLKPFLSKNRCDAIDTMLRIATLGHVFQQLK
ncbi:MAG: hypothetical protein IJW49_08460 [Clostridia bacterium]|nr:hypothetical protein [Clostridia bacterium]